MWLNSETTLTVLKLSLKYFEAPTEKRGLCSLPLILEGLPTASVKGLQQK